MTDLLSRANVDIAINTLLDDLQPNDAIQPSDHNGLLKDILDTLSNGLSTTLRTGNTTDGQNLTITSSSIFQFENGSNGRLQSGSLTAFRNWTLPDKNGTVAMLSDITGGDNISNADLTQTDVDRTYTMPNLGKLAFGGTNSEFHLEDAIDFKMFNGSNDTASNERLGFFVGPTTCYLNFNNSRTSITTVNDDLTLTGFKSLSVLKTEIVLGADIILKSQDTRSVQLKANHLFFMNNAGTTKGRINADTFIWGSNTAIGSEGFSVQKDMLVKGSNNASGTSGFKVTDVNNSLLLDIKNNGQINASSLPTSSAGLSSGDIWNNSGVLNIV